MSSMRPPPAPSARGHAAGQAVVLTALRSARRPRGVKRRVPPPTSSEIPPLWCRCEAACRASTFLCVAPSVTHLCSPCGIYPLLSEGCVCVWESRARASAVLRAKLSRSRVSHESHGLTGGLSSETACGCATMCATRHSTRGGSERDIPGDEVSLSASHVDLVARPFSSESRENMWQPELTTQSHTLTLH